MSDIRVDVIHLRVEQRSSKLRARELDAQLYEAIKNCTGFVRAVQLVPDAMSPGDFFALLTVTEA